MLKSQPNNKKTQKKMQTLLKKCSAMCLTLIAIIITQSIILAYGNLNWNNFSTTTIYTILFSTILLSSFWFFVKPILESKIKIEKEVSELKKFKQNFNFFQFHYKNIEEYDGFEDLKGITFGKENTTSQVTLILSPNCKDSHKAFKEAYTLFQNYSEKIYLKVLFNVNPITLDNTNKSVIEDLLALNEQNPKKAQEAIIDWYINHLDLKTWKRKWTVETPHFLINKQLQNQYYWCVKNELNYTPIKIINENLFPDEYELSELEYFINDFQEEFEFEEALKAV